jgi:hypothetical protein
MAVSKRLRYEVLRRDNFACRYCGATAPEARLVVDAVVPDALGGSHKDPANLVTACEPCNNGKSATPPDAATIADVAQDALRWSRAMAAAAEITLARDEEVTGAQERFAEVWDAWTYGDGKLPVPRDPGWRESVSSLMAAGLPMPVLEECIGIAMRRRRVTPDNTFRYMCGVAWKKVGELQALARDLPPLAEASAGAADSTSGQARDALDKWCGDMLGGRDERDVEIARRDCRDRSGEDFPAGILWFVINNLERDRASLRETLRDLMLALPPEIGLRFIRQHERYYRERFGDSLRPDTALVSAAQFATGEIAFASARQQMAMLPRRDYDEWVQRARDENAEFAEHLSDDYYVTEAARLMREEGEAA